MSGRPSPLRILVVTQLPPPPLGQAVTAQSLLSGRYQSLLLFHVRMAFSRETADIGKPRLRKLLHLLGLVIRILWQRVRTGAEVLYFPPAGPDLVPVLRDLVILLSTRWAFRATVFHFHAAGLTEIESRLPRPLRVLYRAAYGRPELAIQTSSLNPPDGRRLCAKRVVIVANGVADNRLAQRERVSPHTGAPVILYMGVLRESKGLLVLVEACRRLALRGLDFRLHLAGGLESGQFEATLRRALAAAGLESRTAVLGVLAGEAKATCFAASDIFCYPTYFEAESFGRVLVEAMQFSLPVVATRWRGVPSVVADGESGVLVPARDPLALEAALAKLLDDRGLRDQLGARGRELYLERFTEDAFRQSMEAVLRDV